MSFNEPDLTRILGGIYVGSLQPIIDHVPLKAQYNISSILSIIKFNVIPEYLVRKSYTLKNIPIDDTENEDVLQYFNETNRFIDNCLFPEMEEYDPRKIDFKKIPQKGAIFIHCQAGVSRSPTFVIAYLMYRYGLTLKMALHALKRKRPQAQPNDNFIEQLELFERMGGQYVDPENKEYKQWKLAKSLIEDPTGSQILQKDSTYNNDIDTDTKKLSNIPDEELDKISVVRCKKCRQKLALSTSFINHEPPSKESSEGHFIRRATYGRRIVNIQESQDQCSHFFVEPLNWMKEELQGKQELEGKFLCPGCKTKIGGYNWKGSRCSCGKWVIPAIHLLTNKVDQFPVKSIYLPNVVDFQSS